MRESIKTDYTNVGGSTQWKRPLHKQPPWLEGKKHLEDWHYEARMRRIDAAIRANFARHGRVPKCTRDAVNAPFDLRGLSRYSCRGNEPR